MPQSTDFVFKQRTYAHITLDCPACEEPFDAYFRDASCSLGSNVSYYCKRDHKAVIYVSSADYQKVRNYAEPANAADPANHHQIRWDDAMIIDPAAGAYALVDYVLGAAGTILPVAPGASPFRALKNCCVRCIQSCISFKAA